MQERPLSDDIMYIIMLWISRNEYNWKQFNSWQVVQHLDMRCTSYKIRQIVRFFIEHDLTSYYLILQLAS